MKSDSLRTGMTIETNGAASFIQSYVWLDLANFADDGLEFTVRIAGNLAGRFHLHFDIAHPGPQPVGDYFRGRLIESRRRQVADVNQVKTFLDDLGLAQRQAVKDRVEPVDATPVARDQHIVGAAFDARDQG